MRRFSASILILIILLPFTVIFAAPVVCPDGRVYNDRCPTSVQTLQTVGRFNPSITSIAGGGDNFGGMNFSGVGGAVLSCYNVGKSISGGISSLFKKSKDTASTAITAANRIGGGSGGVGGTEQPVSDTAAREELRRQSENLEKQTQRENCLNGVAYQIAKGLLAQTVQRTVSWISTGFNGNPFYVRDMDSYLRSIRTQKLSDFLRKIPNDDPVFGNAVRSAITRQVTGYTDGRIDETMNTPEAREYEAFQNDFTQGGWQAFLNPRNNSLGAYFNAVDRISGDINRTQQNTVNELLQGQGFLSMKRCVEWNNDTSYDSITNSCKANYQRQLADELATCAQRTDTILRNGCINGVNSKYNTLINSCIRNDASISAADSDQCLRYETVTPGSVISAQAAAVTTSSARQLEQADEINEVLGSFFDSLLNRLFTGGLGGIGGSSGNQRGSNVVYNTNGQALESINTTSAEQGLGYSAISGGFNGEFDISRPQQLRAVIKSQIDFVNRTKDVQAAIAPIIPTLGQLDYCVPGPNPTWKVGTDYNANIILSTLSGQPSSKNSLGSTISSLSSAAGAIPGPGPVIAIVGNVVGGIVNSVFGGNTNPTELTADPLNVFDKSYNSAQKLSRLYLKQDGGIGDYKRPMLDEMKQRYGDLMNVYQKVYSRDVIKKVLIAADQMNSGLNSLAVATATADEILDETGALIYYNQDLSQISAQNISDIQQTDEAILKLQAINAEVDKIVSGAKQRYITQNPGVNLACLDSAYSVSMNAQGVVPEVTGTIIPSTGTTRYESDALDPTVLRSQNAEQYFYTHL